MDHGVEDGVESFFGYHHFSLDGFEYYSALVDEEDCRNFFYTIKLSYAAVRVIQDGIPCFGIVQKISHFVRLALPVDGSYGKENEINSKAL